jgi:DNA polymerase III alpha subunit (gram-positive type)
MSTELYVSTDVETDGPIPGPNSMLSFGSAVFTASGEMIDQFEANLFMLPDACGNEETMNWWATQPDAWIACRQNLQDPEIAMKSYATWLKGLPGKPVFVGYPAGFDFSFVYWYLIRFAGESPFGFSALDIKTYAMAVLGTDFRGTVKKTMPKEWFSKRPHTHRAIDDAIEQGELFCNILKARHERKE